jgi:hypothetical protein
MATARVLGRKRESDGAAVGHQHAGLGSTVSADAVQIGFEIKSEFKWFETFSNYFKLLSIRKVLSRAQKN